MSQIMIAGLSGSGKTTFLAALNWSLQEPPENASLTVVTRHGDTTYIDNQTKRWSAAKPLERTALGRTYPIQWECSTSNREHITINCPDMSGELYQQAWAQRRWSRQFDAEVSCTSALLLFLKANVRYTPVTLSSVQQATQMLGEEEEPACAANVEWEPSLASQQGQLLDLLQCVLARCKRPRVAIIISAWDLIKDPEARPGIWLRENAPLLHQYLLANEVNSQIFGVSAQGCDYKETQRVEALREEPPQNRIVVVDESGTTDQNIAKPLAWLAHITQG